MMTGLPVTGAFAAALTPFGADGQPSLERLAQHCLALLDAGCDGVAPLGTTGEANSLGRSFRLTVPGALAKAGLPSERVILGIGACAVDDAVEYTRAALAAGYGNVLALPPFYYKSPSDEGLYAFFAALIDRVADSRLRLFLYHFPGMSTVAIPAAVIARLREAYGPVVAGLKDSGGDFNHTAMLIKEFPGFQVYSGSEQFLLRTMRAGGAGCISASANVTARLCAAILAAATPEEADALDARLSATRLAIQRYPMSAALKQLLAWSTGDESWLALAPPLVLLDADRRRGLLDDVAGLGSETLSRLALRLPA